MFNQHRMVETLNFSQRHGYTKNRHDRFKCVKCDAGLFLTNEVLKGLFHINYITIFNKLLLSCPVSDAEYDMEMLLK